MKSNQSIHKETGIEHFKSQKHIYEKDGVTKRLLEKYKAPANLMNLDASVKELKSIKAA